MYFQIGNVRKAAARFVAQVYGPNGRTIKEAIRIDVPENGRRLARSKLVAKRQTNLEVLVISGTGERPESRLYRAEWFFRPDFELKCWLWSGAKLFNSCRAWKMLQNTYWCLLSEICFDTAENELAKKLQNLFLQIIYNFCKLLLIPPLYYNPGPALASAH